MKEDHQMDEKQSLDNDKNKSVDRRRELNRQAAQKLRNRQKERAVTVKQDYFAAQSRNTQLLYDVKQLKKLRTSIMQKLESHLPMCQRAASAMSPQAQLTASLMPSTPNAASVPSYVMLSSGAQMQQPMVLCLPSDYNNTSGMQLVTIAPQDLGFTSVDGGYMADNGAASTIQPANLTDVLSQQTNIVLENNNGVASSDETSMDIPAVNGESEQETSSSQHVMESANVMTNVEPPRSVASECAPIDEDKRVTEVASVPTSPVTRNKSQRTRRAKSVTAEAVRKSPKVPAKRSASQISSSSADEPLPKTCSTTVDGVPLTVESITDDDEA